MTIATIILATILLLPLCYILLATITFSFATLTWIRNSNTWRASKRKQPSSSSPSPSSSSSSPSLLSSDENSSPSIWSTINTALYCGRVSHTRYKPLVHAFAYPLFYCLLDLSEVDTLFNNNSHGHGHGRGDKNTGEHQHQGERGILWPLNILMTFRDEDHLKNGEGLKKSTSTSIDDNEDEDNTLFDRVRRLVSERTGGKCNPSSEQKIFILTHLSYYGYCFNPVSFYYILKDNQINDGDNNVEAIVAEVSNTPWNEMCCYVLHPNSCDVNDVKEGRLRKSDGVNTITDNVNVNNGENAHMKKDWKSTNYIFQKTFHVSPFMEMDYIYDWTFWDMKRDRIAASLNMIKHKKDDTHARTENEKEEVADGVKCFNAFFDIRQIPFNPFALCYQLVKFPVYCLIIQIWIHVQALKLLIKGVEFIPHPEGSETRASMIIASIMEPYFVLKEKFDSWREKKIKIN